MSTSTPIYTAAMTRLRNSHRYALDWFRQQARLVAPIDLSVIPPGEYFTGSHSQLLMIRTAQDFQAIIEEMPDRIGEISRMISDIECIADRMGQIDLSVGKAPGSCRMPGDVFIGVMSEPLRRLYRLDRCAAKKHRQFHSRQARNHRKVGDTSARHDQLATDQNLLRHLLIESIFQEFPHCAGVLRQRGPNSTIDFRAGWMVVVKPGPPRVYVFTRTMDGSMPMRHPVMDKLPQLLDVLRR